LLEEALACRRIDSLRSGMELLTSGRRLRFGAMVSGPVIRLLDTLVKAELYQELRIDTDLVLEFKFVTGSVKNRPCPLTPPALSRVNAQFCSAYLPWKFWAFSGKESRLPN
jgi:hypothetical protein